MSQGFSVILLTSLVCSSFMIDQTIQNQNLDTKNCTFGQFKNPSGNCVQCLSTCSRCKSLEITCEGCSEGYQLNQNKSQCTPCLFGNLVCNKNETTESASIGFYSFIQKNYLSFNVLSAPLLFFDKSTNIYLTPLSNKLGATFSTLDGSIIYKKQYSSSINFQSLSQGKNDIKNPQMTFQLSGKQSNSLNLRQQSTETSKQEPLVGAPRGIYDQSTNLFFSPESKITSSQNRKLREIQDLNNVDSPTFSNTFIKETSNKIEKVSMVVFPQNSASSSFDTESSDIFNTLAVLPQNALKNGKNKGFQKTIFILNNFHLQNQSETNSKISNSQAIPLSSDKSENILAYFDMKSCQISQYLDSELNCQSCSPKCATCLNSADQCLKCSQNRIKVGWKCVTKQYLNFYLVFSPSQGTENKQYSDVVNEFKMSLIENILPLSYKKMSLDVITMTQFQYRKLQDTYEVRGIVDKIQSIELQDLEKQFNQKLSTSNFNGKFIVKDSSTSVYIEPEKTASPQKQDQISLSSDDGSLKTNNFVAISVLASLSGVLLISLVIMSACYWRIAKEKAKDSSSDQSDKKDMVLQDGTPNCSAGTFPNNIENV